MPYLRPIRQQMRRLVELLEKSGLDFKTIPGMGELINGKVTVNAIREVAYRDLLGREIIKLEEEKIGAYLKDQRCVGDRRRRFHRFRALPTDLPFSTRKDHFIRKGGKPVVRDRTGVEAKF